jgi:hypothetical protein
MCWVKGLIEELSFTILAGAIHKLEWGMIRDNLTLALLIC